MMFARKSQEPKEIFDCLKTEKGTVKKLLQERLLKIAAEQDLVEYELSLLTSTSYPEIELRRATLLVEKRKNEIALGNYERIIGHLEQGGES